MKRFIIRKFVFEGKTEWLNSFIALAAAMFVFSIFLLGFYNSGSSNLYKDTNVKESKAILQTIGFTANKIFADTNMTYTGDPAAPVFNGTPIGYRQSIQALVDLIVAGDPLVNSLYVGASSGANPNDSLVAGHGELASGSRYPEPNAISFSQSSLSRGLTTVKQVEDESAMHSYFRGFSRRGFTYDSAMMTRIDGWKFNLWTKLVIILALFLAVALLGLLVSKVIKAGTLQSIILIVFFAGFSLASLLLTLNFTKGDYVHNRDELVRFYTFMNDSSAKVLADNYGYALTPEDSDALVKTFNTDKYNDVVDGYFYNEASSKIEESQEFFIKNMNEKNVLVGIGWAIGLVFGALSVVFLLRKRGVERFLNSLYNFSTAYLFIMPGIIGMLILVFVPIVFTIILGFSSLPKYFTEINLARNMAGFRNFAVILGTFNLKSPQNFYYTFGFTILYSVVAIFIQVVLGVLVAVVLHQNEVKMKSFFQVAFMLPWIIPTYISGIIWNYFFTNNGVIDQVMNVISQSRMISQAMHGMAVTAGGQVYTSGWFGDPVLGFFIVSFVSAWYAFPFIMLVTLSALQTIPKEIHEAALIDGASWFQSLFRIILPMIRPTVLPSVLLTSIWTFNNFNLVYLVTGGRDEYDILVTRIYDFVATNPERAAQFGWTYGYGAAYSTLIFIILLFYIYIFARASKLTEKSF